MPRSTLNRIKQLRALHQPPLTQADLGHALGVPQQAVSMWETGEDSPTLRNAIAVALFFHTTVERVFYGLYEAHPVERIDGGGNPA